jgi:hypothetical protein
MTVADVRHNQRVECMRVETEEVGAGKPAGRAFAVRFAKAAETCPREDGPYSGKIANRVAEAESVIAAKSSRTRR